MSKIADHMIELRDNPSHHRLTEYSHWFGYSFPFLACQVVSQTVDNVRLGKPFSRHPLRRALRDTKQTAAERDY